MIALETSHEFLNPPEVARMLRVKVQKVYIWIRSGELPASDCSTGRLRRPRYKIAKADLQDFLNRRSASPQPAPQRRRRKQPDNVIPFYE